MKHKRHLAILLILALLMLGALACSNFGYNDGVVTADVTVSAASLNKIVESVRVESDNFVGKVESVDLIEPNIMRVTGEFKILDKDQKGSVDFAITTGQDGVQVDAVGSTMAGVDGNSKGVRAFTSALETALNIFASKDGGGGITAVQVKEGQLVFTVSVKVSGSD